MWHRRCFLSLWVALAALPAHARWTVETRPLDTRPYTREPRPLMRMHEQSGGLTHLEGVGVDLARGSTVLFDVPLQKDDRPRQLELHVGYVTNDPLSGHKAGCAVSFHVEAGEPRRVDLTVPLRSLDAFSIPVEEVRARYDYFTPQVELPLPAGATRLKVTAQVDGACAAGRLFVMDPKVWLRVSDEKPRRLIFLPSDSIGGEWFDKGRRFMPFTQDWFARPGARFNTQVISVGTNTNDATNIISKMAYELRDGRQIGVNALGQGLVPAFLEAGYDAPSFNSNLLFSSLWRAAGFRYFVNLELKGSPVNDRHVEVLTDMMIDWLRRHPDHDAFLFTWFSATHVKGIAPRIRPDAPMHRVLEGTSPHSRHWMIQLARTLSYTDLVLEKFLQEPLVEEADVLFFTDHGLNWETLGRDKPLWGRCVHKKAPANWHVELQELRIIAGMRVHGYDPGPIDFETSLIDWVYSALKHHNPELPLETFAGKDLREARPGDPLVAVSHGYRGAIRMNGQHFYFEDACEAHAEVLFLDAKEQPVSSEAAVPLVQALASQNLLMAPYRALTVEVFHGTGDCQVELKFPPALLADGSRAPVSLQVDPTRWYTRLELFMPAVPCNAPDGVIVESSREGCAELQAGYVRLKLPQLFSLARSGLEPLIHLKGPDVSPGAVTVVRPHGTQATYTRKGKAFVSHQEVKPVQSTPLSKELRAAMKRWGYIQDDQADH
jgi:hypothetical protein